MRGPADAAYGRLQLALADMDEAEPAFRRSIAAARADGRLSDAVLDGNSIVWGLTELRQRFADARALSAELQPVAAQYPEGRAWAAWTEGLVAVATGNFRDALASYREAQRTAERLGRERLARDADEEIARILTMIGRADDAITIFDWLRPREDPCARATFLINRSEAYLEDRARAGRTSSERGVSDALAAALTATRACPDSHRRLVAETNSARYALQTDDDEAADAAVAVLVAESPPFDAFTSTCRAT